MENLLDSYSEVRECDYKDEHYSVRDNGAVMRHPKPGKKARPNDNEWTFGTRDEKTYISSWQTPFWVNTIPRFMSWTTLTRIDATTAFPTCAGSRDLRTR